MRTKHTLIMVLILLVLLVPLDMLRDDSSNNFDSIHQTVLETNIDEINSSNFDVVQDSINLALEDYESLTDEEKEQYLEEFETLLDLLEVVEVVTFEEDYSDLLKLTTETVTLEDEDEILLALEDYEDLSPEAQEDLLEEKVLLELLLVKVDLLKEINAFIINNDTVLGLTTETVQIIDRSSIEATLTEYDLLSPEAQAELLDEKQLLDDLLDEIEVLEEVEEFISLHSVVLGLTPATVQINDKTAVEAALAAYDLLSPEAKAKLVSEKELLDSLLEEINVLEEVDTFETTHNSAIALTVETVQTSDRAVVEAALDAYDLLSPEAQTRLSDEKALLDSLLLEINTQEEASDFETNHSGAIALEVATVQTSDKSAVEAALAAYDLLSPEAQAKLVAEKALLDSLLEEINILEEVEDFTTNHSDALALTPATVQISDKASVEAALAAYDLLSPEAQAKLAAEKTLLDSLMTEIIILEDAEGFVTDHADPLALTTGTVQINDKTAVEAALAAYDLLSPEAQAKLVAEKALLDSLLVEILVLEDAASFVANHSSVLGLTPTTVQISDRVAVEAALAAYNLLSPETQAKLASEKVLLDSLLAEIIILEEADEFTSDHVGTLALTPATVQISDRTAVEAALAAYDLLSPEAQAKLTAEKALLDSLLDEIDVLEDVEGFNTNHASALALTPTTVQISDKAEVEAALAAYDLLTPEAQAKLATEKALLESLLEEINVLEEVEQFNTDHAGALALTPATVQTSDKAEVEAALAAYNLLSVEAQADLASEKALLDSLLAEINVIEEVNQFNTDHASALALTPATVQLSDKTYVEAALVAYDLLSIEAQAELASEKALLDSLLAEINVLEEVDGFNTDHARALGLTPATVQISDKADVEAALAAYNLLSPEAQADLASEKVLLDSLLAEILVLEVAASFVADHSIALGLTPATVQISDKATVEAALAAYDLLSVEVQAKLTAEKALLDSLLAEIITLEEADEFTIDHAGVLALTPATVQISDKVAVEAALVAYDLLSPEAQTLLVVEKALLDSLLAEINALEEADEFTTDHAGALALTVETVQISDKAAVEAALAAYDLLSPEAQAKLVAEKALLDSLYNEIVTLEGAIGFTTNHAVVLALTPATVQIGDKAAVEAALSDYELLDAPAQALLVDEKALLDSLLAEIIILEEVDDFVTDHAGALTLTPATVQISDKAEVEAALEAYDLLSPEAQAKVATEKALLDSLLAEINVLEEVEGFNTDHAVALGLTPATVDINDKAAVEAALAAYDLLSVEAQADLASEKALLDSLLAEINVLEEAAGFNTDYSGALGLTPATVLISDKAAVEAALAAYDLLSPEAQAKVTVEKALLDSLLEEINVQEEAAGFTSDHSVVLGLTPATVEITDKAAVEAALAAYDLLSPEAQAKVADEKALLDSLLTEIITLEANEFSSDHSVVLGLTPATVEISDKTAVEAALAAYDLLSPEVQAELMTEKALLDSLLAEINVLEEVEGFNTDHSSALGLSVATAQISDKAEVEAALAAYDLLSPEAQAKLATEKALLDNLLVEIYILEEAAGFSSDHAAALALTPATVEMSDKALVEAALAAYDLLSPEAQAKLAVEKALLDSLLAEINVLEEAAGFNMDHAAVLTLTPATVEITDKAAVEAALAAYDLLSPEAQADLVSEKALLDSLLAEIVVLEEVEGFNMDHSGVLGLTPVTVQISDKAGVEAALAAYDLLSPEAQAKLTTEKALLDSLLAEIFVLEEAAGFETDHAGVLTLTPATVQISDKAAAEAALAAYDLLSPEAQVKLLAEKALLDNLLAEINVLEEAAGFGLDHAGTLALTPATVQISDKTAVEAALAAYDLLSPEAQAELVSEKALLDSLLVEIEALEDVVGFNTDHSAVLGLTPTTVQISDKAAVEAALAAYDSLSPEAQAKLTTEKALLDSLLAEINVLEEVDGFTTAHTGALALTPATVQISDKASVEAALAAYDLLSAEAQADLVAEKALLDSLLAEINILEEVDGFTTTNVGVLGLTPATVQISDKTAVEAALAAYDSLSPEAQADLVAEKALLDSLLVEINILEEVDGFTTTHSSALALTFGTVQISDKASVEAALAAYDLLSPEAQAKVATEKALLDSLLVEINVLEEADGFTITHAGALALTVGTVEISDKAAVEAALTAYDLLSLEAQAKVTVEKALLDDLLLQIDALEEAAGFSSDHSVVLALTPATVQITDKAAVEAALAAYDLLCVEAQAELVTEKALLDSLLVEINVLEEADGFTTTHASALALTVGTVQISDKAAVEAALAAYDLLSPEAQAKVATEKALLDSLLVEINVLEEANGFATSHASVLTLTVGTVQISDKAAVEAALSAYDLLSPEAQAKLATEKALLDSLLAEIVTQESTAFTGAHSGALALTVGTVQISDKAAVEAALAAYDLLSPEVQATLTTEKALLDSLLARINVLEEVDGFTTDHAGALALTVGTVQISDKAAVEAALAAYDLLSPEAQADLVSEKALLDSLLVEINVLEEANGFATTYANELALTVGTVQISDQAALDAALAAYDLLSAEAQAKLTIEKALLDSLVAHIVVLIDADEFGTNHTAALALTVGTVQISDKPAVQAALAAYELLTLEAQAELTTEKALLDSLLTQITVLEETETFTTTHAAVLALTTSTVQISDKAAVQAALDDYALLIPETQTALASERALLISLMNWILCEENSELLDFEAYQETTLVTKDIIVNGRTWSVNNVAIDCNPAYDVCNDLYSLALKDGAYMESSDPYVDGISKITLYHGALNYDSGDSYAFKIEYELQSTPGVWVTFQENGSDLIIDVVSGSLLTFTEIDINIFESVNIRFVPIISNTTDYINLDDIRIYIPVELLE